MYIQSCIASFEEQNVDSFTEVTENFDRIYPIEHDAMKMLLKVKKAIENGSAAPGGELGVDEEPDFC